MIEVINLEIFNINLNIHWESPKEVWDKLDKIYQNMPGWKGNQVWFGEEEKIIEVSVEPSGLQFYAEMPKEEWEIWIKQFKDKATEALGYEIGEPEDGYDFKYYDLK